MRKTPMEWNRGFFTSEILLALGAIAIHRSGLEVPSSSHAKNWCIKKRIFD
jgi:hypothetical protein